MICFILIHVQSQWKYHYKCYNKLKFINEDFIKLYGFTQDPNTLDYMIVMYHAKNGCLKKNLSGIVQDRWVVKLIKLDFIIGGLKIIHQQGLVHCDFHHGNILKIGSGFVLSISDLGLCRPMDRYSKKDDIY